ncbi:MAG: hypothetical protein EPO24_07420 [Bacteroidetes bacterium]|nr:MAG: hypothetical protein EPO24_07420 [Bacteroidota bacterium]
MPVFERLIVKIAKALNREKISYMVIGGQAVIVHGAPRFTRDIDITLGIDTDEAERIYKIARELSLEPGKGVTKDFVKRNALFSVEEQKTKVVVDFIFSFLPYERQAIERAVTIRLGKAEIRFATAEDTIIHKLFAGRPLDIQDVKSIVNGNRKIDKKYLKKWLKDFSLHSGRDLVREYEDIEKEIRG